MSAARRALDGLDAHLDAGVFYDASLCVSELVTNAVLHSSIGPDEELQLDVSIDAGRLRVSVTDSGRGFAAPEALTGDESGWGLFIVDRLSSCWGVDRSEGTRVWFEIGVEAPEHGEDPGDSEAHEGGSHERADGNLRRRSASLRLRPQATA